MTSTATAHGAQACRLPVHDREPVPGNRQRLTRGLIRDHRGPVANDTPQRANYLDRINEQARNRQ
jgi:hypothetical protein